MRFSIWCKTCRRPRSRPFNVTTCFAIRRPRLQEMEAVLVVRDRAPVFVSDNHREQVALGPHKFSLALAKISLAFLFCAE